MHKNPVILLNGAGKFARRERTAAFLVLRRFLRCSTMRPSKDEYQNHRDHSQQRQPTA